jgi:hypothetical protein
MTPWVLRMLGDPPVRLHVSPGRVFRVGRDTEADLCLDDKLVSRRHAEFVVTDDDRLELRDLGSRNGTRLNGRPVAGTIVVVGGDEIRIGAATLVVDGPDDRNQQLQTTEYRNKPGAGKSDAGGTERRRPGAPLARAALAPDVRTSLPGFELLSEVARGRTGVIYRAQSLGMDGRELLVKILDPVFSASENAVARFEAEAQALGRIDHPNIVRLIETSTAEGRHFYTMEAIEGRTLEEVIREQRLLPREAIAIATQVARGLAIAHATKIVHRDVAPASILVTPEGVAKIFDFAFVKTDDDMPSFTNIGDVVGDLRYSSPEQAGNPRAVDHRSDFYGLGATLYHAISGKPPIEGKNYLDTYRKIVGEPPQPLQELAPDVRPKLALCVAKLLEKDPQARYQQAGEVAQALSEALLEAVIAARKVAPPAGVGIGADFQGIELLELIQVIGARRASGVLTVTSDGVEGTLRFRQGDVVDARTPSEPRLLEAALALLDLRSGTFAFRADPNAAPGTDEPLKPAELALEGLRRRS